MPAAAEVLSQKPPPPDLPPVDLGGRCEIIPGSPLPEFDGPGGRAYVARSLRERKADLFAVVSDGRVPARIESLATFRGMEHPNMLRLVDWSTVDWAQDNRRRFALVFERPSGRRLMESMDETREPMADDVLVRGILPAIQGMLRDLSMRGVTAGAIRPTNLFYKDPAGTLVMLGDCVSVPPGYGQPLIVETIERGMAQPSGRGPGSAADDLYALGVTLLMLALGRNPLRGTDDQTILRMKMDKGSYPALTSGVRVPQALIEPLRGLMTDDARQRWSLADLDMWLQGRRLSPKQPQVPKRGARPLEFGGEEHWHCRSVARALTANPPVAAAFLERGDLDKWLRRSLSDEQRAEKVQEAIDGAGAVTRTANQEDRAVARVAIALDPLAPIRYRGVSVVPEGIGTALAEAVCGSGSPQPFAEMVLAQLPMFWVGNQPDFRPEHVPMVQTFDVQRLLMEHTGPGFGIERILYELCPACACQSPLVRDRHVLTLSEMLGALNHVAGRPGRGREPMDRHIAAFITSRNKKMNDQMLAPLAGKGDPGRRIIATMAILADVQNRFGPVRLPDLCDWLVGLMQPAFKRFRHRQTREKLEREAERIAKEGVIDRLLRLVDNPDAVRKDEKGFLTAKRQYEAMTMQIDRLQSAIDAAGGGSDAKGRQWAAITANVLAMAALIVIVLSMAGS